MKDALIPNFHNQLINELLVVSDGGAESQLTLHQFADACRERNSVILPPKDIQLLRRTNHI